MAAMKAVGCRGGFVIAAAALVLANNALAQENLDQGKTGVQLFVSDCTSCHKSPQGLAKAGGLFGLENFLREHYTASRESAKSIANYLRSVNSGQASGRGGRRTTSKGDSKLGEKKKSQAKPADRDAGSGAPNSANAKPSDILAPEDAKPRPPAPIGPAGSAKPAKSD